MRQVTRGWDRQGNRSILHRWSVWRRSVYFRLREANGRDVAEADGRGGSGGRTPGAATARGGAEGRDAHKKDDTNPRLPARNVEIEPNLIPAHPFARDRIALINQSFAKKDKNRTQRPPLGASCTAPAPREPLDSGPNPSHPLPGTGLNSINQSGTRNSENEANARH